MKRLTQIAIIISVLFTTGLSVHACWFEDPPVPCPYCGGSQHEVSFIECPECGETYASCTSHECENSICPGCGAIGVIHGFFPYHCCGIQSSIRVCQPRLAVACGCGAPYTVPSHALATCPDCNQQYHACQGHTCAINPDPVPPDIDPPDTPYDPPLPGDPDYPFPVDPDDPPFYSPDPPFVILPPSDPGDPPVVFPLPPNNPPPADPGDLPIVVTPPDGPPIVILPPASAGDPVTLLPLPPGTVLPGNLGDSPVIGYPEEGLPVIILPPVYPGDPSIVEILQNPTGETETPDPENADVTITTRVYEFDHSSINAAQVYTTVHTIVEITTTTNTVTGDSTTETTAFSMSVWRECLICGAEGAWVLPICPNVNQRCPDCGENIHGAPDHVCSGVPEDPTQADPGAEPQEGGQHDNTPPPQEARFYFARVNQQAITRPVGTTYTIDLPMSVYVASTTGVVPSDTTIYLHCVPDVVVSGATYAPAVASAIIQPFTPPAPPLLMFGRNLYPNLTRSKGDDTWNANDEFLLIISTDPDTEDAVTEAVACCNKTGCRYHLRVKFQYQIKPGR